MNYEEKSPKMEQAAQEAPQSQEDVLTNQTENQEVEEEMEEEVSHEEDELPEEDYSTYSKDELYEALRAAHPVNKLSKEEVEQYYRLLTKIEPFFKSIVQDEREQALEKFLADGGEADGFEYRPDEKTKRFFEIAKALRQRRQAIRQELQEALRNNLKRKQEILEALRHIVESIETEETIRHVKHLQAEWRKTGPVPKRFARDLWARYNALIDMFYNNLSIFHELKELDRKKNLEAKEEICAKIEALVELPVREAFRQLKVLQQEYRHVGPVPQEAKAAIWERYKKAVNAIYEKRRREDELFKQQLQENLAKKKALVEKLAPFAEFDSDRIKEWNAKTDEIKAIQQEWEAVGPVPQEEGKEVSKAFWSKFKQFFKRKGEFFQKLDAERQEHLLKKQDLFEQAKAIVEGATEETIEEAAKKLKKLQDEWRKIGSVPEKARKKIEEGFRKLMNEFFDKRRALHNKKEEVFVENLQKKEALIEQIKARTEEALAEVNPEEEIEQWIEAWVAIGHVPHKDISRIQNAFIKAMHELVLRFPGLDEERREELDLSITIRLAKHKAGGERKLHQKRNQIAQKIRSIREEIDTLRNNIEFFGDSPEAAKMREAYEERIAKAQEQLHVLEKKLELINSI
ncbi:alkylhydroperoxidase/carboxymuconolactone decarboxylase family protein YurZ/outer membrane murein-binding lipoprotein Lpp [Thermonema lapsum]|uniref:Alkylhydroperoxidase/carboxymuconolactone decarboxylase family protein YurZ/outer membrane murein-binding lipoprotein Lpp n=1 Tax=Thermonema lapsum TaxID=28195 RepID=A0A846MN70_9BACT|nr:DUF349 domain-containing protein [Thermonema lapsum]NIK72860.1 alkylhydroperoxidase/carboxymuconolactone decarboxylase family protein YurZ/outer membrane murein-binding lipoprotein Lpp [Thermonema lapsum]